MTSRFPEAAPVVIIGGGIIGVSALYHLAKRGVPAVLIERRKLASGTTWRAAGIVGQLRDSIAELREEWPCIETSDVKSAFFVPSNGQVNPLDVTVALSKGARANGAPNSRRSHSKSSTVGWHKSSCLPRAAPLEPDDHHEGEDMLNQASIDAPRQAAVAPRIANTGAPA